jgi:hypothetical protein
MNEWLKEAMDVMEREVMSMKNTNMHWNIPLS